MQKTPVKVARQVHIQYQISQQDLQPPPSRVFLPSAPMGAPRAFQTGKQSLAMGAAERERLDSEARASADRYLHKGELEGTTMPLLQQPARPTGRNDEPLVPRIRADQLHVRNAGVPLRQQALVQNLQTFMDREQQRKQQQQPTALTVTVNELADSMARQQPVPLSGAVQLQGVMPPPPVDSTMEMEMSTTEMEPKQDDVHMGGDDKAPDSEKEVTEGTT
ncbi:MAG: hypothetical protein GY835_03325 [bacterium]|nr:hypothetical protein [bacterium]